MNKIIIILVIYKKKIINIASYFLIKKILLIYKKNIYLIIVDNGNICQYNEIFFLKNVNYIYKNYNLGISYSYNIGYYFLKKLNGDLLLLLDHDTKLTYEYLYYLLNLNIYFKYSVYIPIIYHKNIQISPFLKGKFFNFKFIKNKKNIKKKIFGINSGLVISKFVLKIIKGFNNDFFLDYLDYWLFWIFSKNKKIKIFILSKFKLKHNISILNYKKLNKKRYLSIINSEILFYKKYNFKNLFYYKIRLFFRIIIQLLSKNKRKFLFITIKKFYYLFFNNERKI